MPEPANVRRPDLVSDCARCVGLCCVAPSFEASQAFALDKPAGIPCPHLQPDFRCEIHGALVERGFAGCAAYDCYGAGPRATRQFAGSTPRERDEAFLCLRIVHELIWQLTEAAKLCARGDLRAELDAEVARLDALAAEPAPALLALDLDPQRARARALLRRVGASLTPRSAAPPS